jgi:hypothetical protein
MQRDGQVLFKGGEAYGIWAVMVVALWTEGELR